MFVGGIMPSGVAPALTQFGRRWNNLPVRKHLMPAPNYLKFFVTDEVGTSSLLATAVDPQFAHHGQRQFREKFCARLKPAGVVLSPDDGPQLVRQEYLSVDLVMAWGEWILLLENKVAAASITRNQLKKEYRIALTELERGKVLGVTNCQRMRICVIYLTPTDSSGCVEFDSLELSSKRSDAKVHLSWKDVLDDLRQAFPDEDSNDLLRAFIQGGCQLTETILSERSKPAITESLERGEMKKFMKSVRRRIVNMLGFEPTLKLTDWRDPGRDELYGHIGGDLGNVYLNVYADGTDLLNNEQTRVHGRISFKVAGKAPMTRLDDFRSYPLETWARILGFNSDDQVTLDIDRCEFSVERDWEGQSIELAEQLASLVCRFMLVFRTFMISPHRDG
jgi:hypothetical protein